MAGLVLESYVAQQASTALQLLWSTQRDMAQMQSSIWLASSCLQEVLPFLYPYRMIAAVAADASRPHTPKREPEPWHAYTYRPVSKSKTKTEDAPSRTILPRPQTKSKPLPSSLSSTSSSSSAPVLSSSPAPVLTLSSCALSCTSSPSSLSSSVSSSSSVSALCSSSSSSSSAPSSWIRSSSSSVSALCSSSSSSSSSSSAPSSWIRSSSPSSSSSAPSSWIRSSSSSVYVLCSSSSSSSSSLSCHSISPSTSAKSSSTGPSKPPIQKWIPFPHPLKPSSFRPLIQNPSIPEVSASKKQQQKEGFRVMHIDIQHPTPSLKKDKNTAVHTSPTLKPKQKKNKDIFCLVETKTAAPFPHQKSKRNRHCAPSLPTIKNRKARAVRRRQQQRQLRGSPGPKPRQEDNQMLENASDDAEATETSEDEQDEDDDGEKEWEPNNPPKPLSNSGGDALDLVISPMNPLQNQRTLFATWDLVADIQSRLIRFSPQRILYLFFSSASSIMHGLSVLRGSIPTQSWHPIVRRRMKQFLDAVLDIAEESKVGFLSPFSLPWIGLWRDDLRARPDLSDIMDTSVPLAREAHENTQKVWSFLIHQGATEHCSLNTYRHLTHHPEWAQLHPRLLDSHTSYSFCPNRNLGDVPPQELLQRSTEIQQALEKLEGHLYILADSLRQQNGTLSLVDICWMETMLLHTLVAGICASVLAQPERRAWERIFQEGLLHEKEQARAELEMETSDLKMHPDLAHIIAQYSHPAAAVSSSHQECDPETRCLVCLCHTESQTIRHEVSRVLFSPAIREVVYGYLLKPEVELRRRWQQIMHHQSHARSNPCVRNWTIDHCGLHYKLKLLYKRFLYRYMTEEEQESGVHVQRTDFHVLGTMLQSQTLRSRKMRRIHISEDEPEEEAK